MNKLLKYIKMGELIERKGIRFYKNALKRVVDGNSKSLLGFLIKEEENHLEFFISLERKYRGKNKEKVLVKSKPPVFRKSDYKRIKGKRAETFNIFNTALQIEIESINLYSSLAKKVRDKKLKNFLIKLANIEKSHFKLIKSHQQTLYDYLYWQVRTQERIEM
ncbi:MAG: ferritin family protein [Candidatus Woesearchaeota archaeon]|nr:ferritin family protein [Candidatus Woesearchaeota archaeon]